MIWLLISSGVLCPHRIDLSDVCSPTKNLLMVLISKRLREQILAVSPRPDWISSLVEVCKNWSLFRSIRMLKIMFLLDYHVLLLLFGVYYRNKIFTGLMKLKVGQWEHLKVLIPIVGNLINNPSTCWQNQL